ncbi:HNH endonuclease, partial [Phormidium sp. CCY1219]|uniref:HNH endonuclease n=1 Tax=Phormidium sp. CCY1219 TaxID=2886104 RepID=UPI002D1F3AF7
MKEQKGKCNECGLFFTDSDLIEIDHIKPLAAEGKDTHKNRQALHQHCHDRKTARDLV